MSARANFNEETYPDEIYLADNAAVIASLALYHRFRQTPDKLTAQWCREVDQHYRDEAGKILVFRIQPDGRPVPEGRGSGAGWNTFYLFYADPEFAAAEFARLKGRLLQRTAVRARSHPRMAREPGQGGRCGLRPGHPGPEPVGYRLRRLGRSRFSRPGHVQPPDAHRRKWSAAPSAASAPTICARPWWANRLCWPCEPPPPGTFASAPHPKRPRPAVE